MWNNQSNQCKIKWETLGEIADHLYKYKELGVTTDDGRLKVKDSEKRVIKFDTGEKCW